MMTADENEHKLKFRLVDTSNTEETEKSIKLTAEEEQESPNEESSEELEAEEFEKSNEMIQPSGPLNHFPKRLELSPPKNTPNNVFEKFPKNNLALLQKKIYLSEKLRMEELSSNSSMSMEMESSEETFSCGEMSNEETVDIEEIINNKNKELEDDSRMSDIIEKSHRMTYPPQIDPSLSYIETFDLDIKIKNRTKNFGIGRFSEPAKLVRKKRQLKQSSIIGKF